MPTPTSYNYTVADTLNEIVNPASLQSEINSQNSGLAIQCDHINVEGALNSSASTIEVVMKDALDVGEQTTLDNLVAAHEGASTSSEPTITSDGFEVVATAPEYVPTGLEAIFEGRAFTATAGATNFFDEVVTSIIRLRGGIYQVSNNGDATVNDYIEFSVIDKDDVTGLFGPNGLTVGNDIIELSKFLKTEYIDPANPNEVNLQTPGYTVVIPGLYFRTTYHSTGATNITFKTRLFTYQ